MLTTLINQIDSAALANLPLAFNAVTAIEAAAKPLPGESKAQLAANVVLAGAAAAQGVPIPAVQAVSGLVALIVSILNATGVFNHGPKFSAPAKV